MKMRTFLLLVVAVALTDDARPALSPSNGPVLHAAAAASPAAASVALRGGFPTAYDVRSLLDGATHFSEFVDVPAGHNRVLAYVSYPDRAEKAPVVLVSTGDDGGMTDWLRAVGVQLSRQGFIAIVPDSAYGPKGDAVRAYASQLPAANGTTARLELFRRDRRITVSLNRRQFNSAFDEQGWVNAVAFLRAQTHNRYVAPTADIHAHVNHAAHAQAAAGQAGRAGRGSGTEAEGASSMSSKRPDLPPHLNLAARTLAESPRKGEWADIPMGDVKLRTWISYPEGTGPAPIVVVVHGTGYGFGDWIRGVADQLAHDGFIALAPDLLSGLGPNGGNTDSFRFPDDVTRGMGRLGSAGALERVKAVRNYGVTLPRANGKSAALGFCSGGGQAFLMAAEGINAAVVYYGGAPRPDVLAKVTAPVIGFYGAEDARLTATVESTVAAMKKLGKVYEPHIYPHTTHGFVTFQDLGENFAATADSWRKAIGFLRQHTK